MCLLISFSAPLLKKDWSTAERCRGLMDPGKGERTPAVLLSDVQIMLDFLKKHKKTKNKNLFCFRSGRGECASRMELGLALKPSLVWVTSTVMSKSSKR